MGNIDPNVDCLNDLYPCVGQFEKSDYFTTDQFSDVLNASPVSVSVLCLNIRSFNTNAGELISMMDSFSKCPDVLVLTETWLTKDVVNMCNLEGYNAYHTVREGRRSGGVSVFCLRGSVSQKIEAVCESNDKIELCAVDVKCASMTNAIFAIYRPHSSSIADITERLMVLTYYYSTKCSKISR